MAGLRSGLSLCALNRAVPWRSARALHRRHLEAVQRLYELAQALLNDFDTFEKVVEENTDISE